MSGRSETYTHGHHESVLRSHRWRTAANSAAYLLPHLGPGLDAARRRLRTRDHHARSRPGRRAGAGRRHRRRRGAAGRRARRGRRGRRRDRRPTRSATPTRSASRTAGSTSSTPTRSSSTSPTRSPRCARWAGSAGPAGSSRPATATTRRWPGSRRPRARPLARALRGRGPPQRRRAGRRPAAARVGARGGVRGRDTVGVDVVLRHARGPRLVGRPLGGPRHRLVVRDPRASTAAWPTGADLERIAEAWRRWADQPDGWFIVPSGEVLCRAG